MQEMTTARAINNLLARGLRPDKLTALGIATAAREWLQVLDLPESLLYSFSFALFKHGSNTSNNNIWNQARTEKISQGAHLARSWRSGIWRAENLHTSTKVVKNTLGSGVQYFRDLAKHQTAFISRQDTKSHGAYGPIATISRAH